jgi:anti-sigma B factor antagonist
LDVKVSHEGGVAIVVPGVKRLDAAVAPAFKEQVVALIREGERRIAIDLAGVTFLDSSGLGAMVSILKALGGQGALAVCGAEGAVLALFKLTRMDKVFAIAAGRAEAVKRLAGG